LRFHVLYSFPAGGSARALFNGP